MDIFKNISRLGLGTMRLPTKGDDVDIEKTKKLVDHFFASGMNYVDTAYMYHNGTSELAVKDAIVKRYPRQKFYLANKLPAWNVKTPEDVSRIFNDQLEKCGVTYFDFYLMHALTGDRSKHLEDMKAYEFCMQMKNEGKIKHLGFSFHGSADDLRHILKTHPEFEFVMLQLNYYDWMGECKEHYEIAREFDKPIVVMEPVRGGALANLPPKAEEVLKGLNPKVSLASWAVRYVASLDGVKVVVSGMSSLEQAVDNVLTLKDFVPLNSAEYKAIEEVQQIMLSTKSVPCTACNYCDICPVGIPIADILAMYNKFLLMNADMEFKGSYNKIPKDKNASACTNCRACVNVCPQNIDVPEVFEKVKNI